MEKNMLIANRLKELSKEKNISYNTLAEKSGVPVRRVYRMANGYISDPGVFLVMSICKALDISLDEFFDTDELRDAFQ